MLQRIGILTSGGDAPGMNAAIRACVRTATEYGVTSVGYLDGFSGLVENRYIELDDRTVGNQIQRGGTFLGTSRSKAFLDPDVRAKAVQQMRDIGVEALIVVGGDGSFRGARALEVEHGLAVAGLPGTIDNDVYGTDETIGFDTAVNSAVQAVDKVRDTSESTGMMFFVEVMGRTSGAIAVHTAVAAGAAGVLVPEEQEDFDRLVERLRSSMARGKRSHIIIVAEGEDAGGAFGAAERVGSLLDNEYRVVILGHTQRGGSPTMRDRIIASQSGALAIDALAAGRSGFMIGMQRGQPVEIDLSEVLSHSRPTSRIDFVRLAGRIAG
ncbi:MAG: 6-phosphofructokinase [Dehalococcoidia bacterium]|nr:6-phosphofructokinase [Dehalococcoidia bacterium]